MIRAEGLGVRAGASWLLRDVSLALAPGTLTAVLGANGAGKTTLLRALNGERAPDAGTVTLDGALLAAHPARLLARRRAVLSQASALAFGLTVAEIVELGRLPHRGTPAAAQDRAALAAMRAAFALDTLWHREFPTLSGGERQRAQLARAAAQLWHPDGDQRDRLLFLDEPAAALDLAQQARALGFAAATAAAGAVVLAVLHDPNHAARADQVVVLRGGRVLAAGPPATVLTESVLAECYGIAVTRIAQPDGTAAFLPA